MKIPLKVLYSLTLTLVFTSGKLPESLVFASILFIFLMIPERKKEELPQRTNLWFSGVFFILITVTAINAVHQQINAPIVIIAYVVLVAILTWDIRKDLKAKP